eukprot:4793038-Pleurochrysis_carterae.AAC.3
MRELETNKTLLATEPGSLIGNDSLGPDKVEASALVGQRGPLHDCPHADAGSSVCIITDCFWVCRSSTPKAGAANLVQLPLQTLTHCSLSLHACAIPSLLFEFSSRPCLDLVLDH